MINVPPICLQKSIMEIVYDICKLPLATAVDLGYNRCFDNLVKEGASVEDNSEAFCAALIYKNLKCAEILWDGGIEVNFKSYHRGVTPLMCAASSDQYSFMQKLIAAGASVNAVNNDGSGALHCSRSKECTELLIHEGADVNLKDHNGFTSLHSAIINYECKKGETPLIKATSDSGAQQIQLLLEKGANVNAFDSSGRNALYHAAKRGNNVILQLLLSRGADVNAVDLNNKKEYSLIAAATKGDEECIKTLLQAGADVNATGSYNSTALTSAANHGHDKCVKLLLEAGAHVKDNPKALMHSALRGSEGCVKLLIEAGADVNICSCSGTALHYAAKEGHASCIDLLLRAGSDVNSLSMNNRSPLMFAAVKNRLESVKLLLRAGAEVRLTDKVGCSSLQYSVVEHVRRGKSQVVTEMVRLLHAAGESKERRCSRTIPYFKRIRTEHIRLNSILNDDPIESSINLDQLPAIVRQYLNEDDPTPVFKGHLSSNNTRTSAADESRQSVRSCSSSGFTVTAH